MDPISITFAIVAGITANLLTPKLKKLYTSIKQYSGGKNAYLDELSNLLSEMPFIFHGITQKVMEDYVEIQYKSLDYRTLTPKDNTTSLNRNNELIKNKKHILVLGAAGIGKTTFQRHFILSLINKKNLEDFIQKSEAPIPVFVPLKAVDNSQPFPIIRYITSNKGYFFGERGITRLKRLATKKQIILFLDGYDEISFVQNQTNNAAQEIEIIFGSNSGFGNNHEMINLCHALSDNRVWLSSRMDFFQKNPINLKGKRPSFEVLPVLFYGLGSEKMKLIESIFTKYTRNQPELEPYLDAEFFLSLINDSHEQEILNLSENPLFLTVICFLYCKKITYNTHHSIEEITEYFNGLGTFSEIVEKCIDLLINDLDEGKARDLGIAQQKALLKRRNEYHLEKKEFLNHFSAKLFIEKINVFSLKELIEEVEFYFSEKSDSENAKKIVLDTKNISHQNPNFALQLIYCGIFCAAATKNGDFLYDFPHRRFREVLAIPAFKDPKKYLEILVQYDSKDLSEFLLLFKASEVYLNPNLHTKTYEIALNECSNKNCEYDCQNAVVGAYALKPRDISFSAKTELFLTTNLLRPSPWFKVPVKTLNNNFSLEFREFITNLCRINEGIESQKLFIAMLVDAITSDKIQNSVLLRYEANDFHEPTEFAIWLFSLIAVYPKELNQKNKLLNDIKLKLKDKNFSEAIIPFLSKSLKLRIAPKELQDLQIELLSNIITTLNEEQRIKLATRFSHDGLFDLLPSSALSIETLNFVNALNSNSIFNTVISEEINEKDTLYFVNKNSFSNLFSWLKNEIITSGQVFANFKKSTPWDLVGKPAFLNRNDILVAELGKDSLKQLNDFINRFAESYLVLILTSDSLKYFVDAEIKGIVLNKLVDALERSVWTPKSTTIQGERKVFEKCNIINFNTALDKDYIACQTNTAKVIKIKKLIKEEKSRSMHFYDFFI